MTYLRRTLYGRINGTDEFASHAKRVSFTLYKSGPIESLRSSVVREPDYRLVSGLSLVQISSLSQVLSFLHARDVIALHYGFGESEIMMALFLLSFQNTASSM